MQEIFYIILEHPVSHDLFVLIRVYNSRLYGIDSTLHIMLNTKLEQHRVEKILS